MKNSILTIISGIIFPIAFVVLFFLIGGTNHGITCWIGFGFIFFAYIMLIANGLFVTRSKSSHVFAESSGIIVTAYMIIEFVSGIAFIIVDFKQWKIALVAEIVLLAIFLISYIFAINSNEKTAISENNQYDSAYFVKLLCNEAKSISNSCTDITIKNEIIKICDELDSCTLKDYRFTENIDNEIKNKLSALKLEVSTNNIEGVKEITRETIVLIKSRKNI